MFVKWKEWLSTQYFERPELIKSGERAGEQNNVRISKPPTVQGFCLYSGFHVESFYDWLRRESDNIDDSLFQAISRVHDYIKDYQVAGAMTNVFNPLVVLRVNGIGENVNVNQNTKVVVESAPLLESSKSKVIDLTDMEFEILSYEKPE
jgi:hypothetical protein